MESRGILSRLNNSDCLGERLAAALGVAGVAVTDQEIFDIEGQRSESLRSHGLLELDSGMRLAFAINLTIAEIEAASWVDRAQDAAVFT